MCIRREVFCGLAIWPGAPVLAMSTSLDLFRIGLPDNTTLFRPVHGQLPSTSHGKCDRALPRP